MCMEEFDKVAMNFRTLGRAANFYKKPQDAAIKAGDSIRKLNKSEISDQMKQEAKDVGNGMFADMGFWGVGLFNKRLKEKSLNKLTNFKQGITEKDQVLAQKVIDGVGVKDGGLLHKFLTIKKPLAVAEVKNNPSKLVGGSKERTLYDMDARVPSLLAPIQNTARASSPILASMYVGDKLYPAEEKVASNVIENEKNGLDELSIIQLDKTAALQKVAQLEEKLDETTEMLKTAMDEKYRYQKALEKEALEKKAAISKTAELEESLMKKTAEHEELFLRSRAQLRSKHVVKIAETMLEKGMIKQAEFDERVDYLMDCDDKVFNLYTLISKSANINEKSLETSAYIVETRDRAENPVSVKGFSKRGQTIGEAASDLLK